MRIKVCGITRLEDALLVDSCGSDALGYIFYEGSTRYIEPEQAGIINRSLSPFISKVGVFVNASPDEINRIGREARLNAVQLHGKESKGIISRIDLPVIKAFRVKDGFDFSILNLYNNCSLLLDAYSENSYGGTGLSFEWEQIPVDLRNKIILAGGIGTENIEYILSEIRPAAIDLSSSLESAPGIKDAEKVKRFFEIIN